MHILFSSPNRRRFTPTLLSSLAVFADAAYARARFVMHVSSGNETSSRAAAIVAADREVDKLLGVRK